MYWNEWKINFPIFSFWDMVVLTISIRPKRWKISQDQKKNFVRFKNKIDTFQTILGKKNFWRIIFLMLENCRLLSRTGPKILHFKFPDRQYKKLTIKLNPRSFYQVLSLTRRNLSFYSNREKKRRMHSTSCVFISKNKGELFLSRRVFNGDYVSSISVNVESSIVTICTHYLFYILINY